MPVNSGRNSPDVKTQVTLGNSVFTKRFSITGLLETASITPKLFSPLPLIQTLPHNQLITLTRPWIASTSNLDNSTGIGARVLVVNGLSSSFILQEEVILLTGQTPVQTQLEYIRILEMTILQLGSNTNIDTGDLAPAGDIYCAVTNSFTLGVPTDPITGIKASTNNLNSRDAIFTVPDGEFALIRDIFATTTPDKTENNNIEIEIGFGLFGLPVNHWYKSLPYNFDSTYNNKYESLILAPPRTNIQVRGRMTLNKTKKATVEMSVELIAASRISF
jgi:hypothetical protein